MGNVKSMGAGEGQGWCIVFPHILKINICTIYMLYVHKEGEGGEGGDGKSPSVLCTSCCGRERDTEFKGLSHENPNWLNQICVHTPELLV